MMDGFGKEDVLSMLDSIDPAALDYQDWVNVGMALKHAGLTARDWDAWSQRDPMRYHQGECEKKWQSFLEQTASPITTGTLYQMAKGCGWQPPRGDQDGGHELSWDGMIGGDDLVIVDRHYIQGEELKEPGTDWDQVKDIITYLETLFDPGDYVGYVTDSYEVEGRHLPTKGYYTRTAAQIIGELKKTHKIAWALGEYKEEAGAWIRFNPLDGKGVKNENVTQFRYALVESDAMSLEEQNEIIRKLELPVACLVHSGNKSIHAIVRVDAANYDEYRKRVDYLYKVCQKNGLVIDSQNRNPSRLSRMPGIVRNGKKQYLIDTNIGQPSWESWHEWIESVNDDLPDPEPLDKYWANLPPLAEPLIEGLLRKGHKMLESGPSKAGKSYSLIQLCIAIAEGSCWLGNPDWQCAQGNVLYVNLELDRASCFHRFHDVYTKLGQRPDNLGRIDIWNLRGRAVPMDKLAPKLIRRAQKQDYAAVIIDPIYKVLTGDENSAEQMALFCNQFDRIASSLGSAVIYCHHHSKGYQGQKRSMDRASGSGVFARDPDVLLDMTELELDGDIKAVLESRTIAKVYDDLLRTNAPHYYEKNIAIYRDISNVNLLKHVEAVMEPGELKALGIDQEIETARNRARMMTAWRLEGTLREFEPFQPVDVFFEYPIHRMDETKLLEKLKPESEKAPWEKAKGGRKTKKELKEERMAAFETAFDACSAGGKKVTTEDLSQYLGVTTRTVWNRIKEHGGFDFERKEVGEPSAVFRKGEA